MEIQRSLVNLGYANGWPGPKFLHPMVEECLKLKHSRKVSNVGSCLTHYVCHSCKYEYLVDSSD